MLKNVQFRRGVSNPRSRPYDPHDSDHATLYPRPYDPAHNPTTLSTNLRPWDSANVIFRHPQNFSMSYTFQYACSSSTKFFNQLHFPVRLFSRAIHFAGLLRGLKVRRIKYSSNWQYPTTLRYDIHSKIKSKLTLINQIISCIESIHQLNLSINLISSNSIIWIKTVPFSSCFCFKSQ